MEKRRVFAEVGMYLHLTEWEEEVIFKGDDIKAKTATLLRIIAEGRFNLEGDCFIPNLSIAQFNNLYGTDYFNDIDVDLYLN